jgi:hypothetical protein
MPIATPSDTVLRIVRDFLAAVLQSPDQPTDVGRAAPRRYRSRPYPEAVAKRIGPAIAALSAEGIIRPTSARAVISGRPSRHRGLVGQWILGDPVLARDRLAALNRRLRSRPQPGLYDAETSDE